MTEACVLQGRRLEPGDVESVRRLVAEHPEWSRYRLSRELCALWNWRTDTGAWKDMAARTLLSKLEQRGWVRLPARRFASPNRHRLSAPAACEWDATPIAGALGDLGPLEIIEISTVPAERARARDALAQFHYLGWRAPVGESLQYAVRDRRGRWLAVLVFGAAAWKCAARDAWIGWERPRREAGLGRIAGNHRFLILPWVRVPHLASSILGRIARRIAGDWQAKYGHRVLLLETFVEHERFAGTCYKAANWRCLGRTTGRSRQDRGRTLRVPTKDVYVYALGTACREELAA